MKHSDEAGRHEMKAGNKVKMRSKNRVSTGGGELSRRNVKQAITEPEQVEEEEQEDDEGNEDEDDHDDQEIPKTADGGVDTVAVAVARGVPVAVCRRVGVLVNDLAGLTGSLMELGGAESVRSGISTDGVEVRVRT